ncbi:hypothetical protein CABS01_04752 [Colletotrichum abscissum]|uniref:uncharacterized protein n=1 Tax=Colletotrichum abscissum TaxID=1671311 RepID=UPI0027D7155D|nr:uncharacterized protein CABS01_04752 [Colletotrichum abscissum]KAK1472109.1 hypothetical protein CABS01_04752 [Colletotrichum abscissum]
MWLLCPHFGIRIWICAGSSMCLPAQFLSHTTSYQTALRKSLKPAAHYLTTCHIFSFPFLPFPSAQGAQVGVFFPLLLLPFEPHDPPCPYNNNQKAGQPQGHQKAPRL